MNNEETSFESLYSEALGISDSNRPVFSQSNEGFDGFDDALEVEIARSFENLAFLDTYTAMQQKNSAEMIRMCKKLSVNYGLKSGVNEKAATSIESLCRIRSMEADAAAVDAGAEPKVADDDKPKEDGKKKGVFQKILAGLKKIFKAIAEFFIQICEKIKQFFIVKIGKIDGDLSADQIKGLLANEEIWKGAPDVIVGGTLNIRDLDYHCKVLNENVGTIKKIVSDKKATNLEKFRKYEDEYSKIVRARGDNGIAFGLQFSYSVGLTPDKKQKAAQWAAKASNLKSAIDSIKNAERSIKSMNAMCKSMEKLCDLLEKDADPHTNTSCATILRFNSDVCNTQRKRLMDVVKGVIFAKKLYNAGKHAKGEAVPTEEAKSE